MENPSEADVLVAGWKHTQDITIEPAYEGIWASGVPTDSQDHFNHPTDTHTWVSTANGTERHIFPNLVADVRYDHSVGVWVLDGPGRAHISLEVIDSSAPDDELIAALRAQLVVYKVRIHR